MLRALNPIPIALAALTLAGCASQSAAEGGGTATSERPAAAAPAGETSTSDSTAAAPGQAPAGETAAQCDASKAQFVVGQNYTDALAAQAQAAAGAKTVRRLVPGQAVTMEFNGERLNLETDASSVIVTVRCG